MRLAVITDTFPRWSERFVAREVNELRRRGVDLTVFALNRGTLPDGSDPEWEAADQGTRVLPPVASAETVGGALASLPKLRDAGARERLEAVRKALGTRGLAHAARAVAFSSLLSEGKYTHVHAHFANWPSTVGWIAALEAGLPFSFSAHARDLFVEPQLLEEKARDATAFFACHEQAYQQLNAVAEHGRKAVRMLHGLPLDQFAFDARPAGHAVDGVPALSAVGRFVAKKGFTLLLEALRTDALKDRPLRLSFFGEGPEGEALSDLADKASDRHEIRFHAPISGPSLWAGLKSTGMLVAPFRLTEDQDRDGIPNIVLEAFATGTPVVGTDAGGLPEILSASTGWVARAEDVASLAEAICECLDQVDERRRRARSAREIVEARHDITGTIAPLLSVIQSG